MFRTETKNYQTVSLNHILAMRNNVTRFLESQNIPFTAFPVPPEKRTAVETAQVLGVDPDTVFKSIVVLRVTKGKPILAVIPGPAEVDLKALAKAVGEKKLKLATKNEAENLTSLQTGGISPLALINRGFEIILDEFAQIFNEIHISGGDRGLNILISVDHLSKITSAKFAEISTFET